MELIEVKITQCAGKGAVEVEGSAAGPDSSFDGKPKSARNSSTLRAEQSKG